MDENCVSSVVASVLLSAQFCEFHRVGRNFGSLTRWHLRQWKGRRLQSKNNEFCVCVCVCVVAPLFPRSSIEITCLQCFPTTLYACWYSIIITLLLGLNHHRQYCHWYQLIYHPPPLKSHPRTLEWFTTFPATILKSHSVSRWERLPRYTLLFHSPKTAIKRPGIQTAKIYGNRQKHALIAKSCLTFARILSS